MKQQPNILFIFSDQQRWDTVSSYGYPLGKHFNLTPNLDRLADEGVLFENAFTCQPVCGPARACIQTGLYATEANCFTNHMMPPAEKMALAPSLINAGYQVGYIGKWHLASFGPKEGKDDYRTKPVPLDRRGGYTDFWVASDALEFTSHSYDGFMYNADGSKFEFPDGRYRADVLTDRAIEFLNDRKNEKPFFLMVSYIEPHHQNDHGHFEGPKGSKERFKNFPVPEDLTGLDGDWKEEMPDYLGCCASLDENIGRMVNELKKLGLYDETTIIYTSDHGNHFRTRNSEYKRSCHDSCIRIPMIIKGTNLKGGKVVKELISLIDIPPTILSEANTDIPGCFRGRPLQQLIKDKSPDWPEEVFIQISETQCGRAIRTDRWKYSVRAPHNIGYESQSNYYIEDFLYDLLNDPYEHNNLVANSELISIRAELAEKLLRYIETIEKNKPVIISNSGLLL